jgi:tRNA nucleotidyltransferase (CCA-adding enzyme)
MKTPELIVTHGNTDLDAFAAMVAARKLYPRARICLPGALNRNVRELAAAYAAELAPITQSEVDLKSVRRLIMVDTVHSGRLGELAVLCEREGVAVVAFDHHSELERPPYILPENLVRSDDGSLVTLMLRIIAERGIPVTPREATIFALGIHEDTGSLTFATTRVSDAEALAFCMRRGADPAVIVQFLQSPLSDPQRQALAAALNAAERLPLPGLTVLVATLKRTAYVEGVSVVAHRVMDLVHCDAFFLLAEMEQRVFITARSRGDLLDVNRILAPLGGGGHAAAASAVLKDVPIDVCRERLVASVTACAADMPSVGERARPGLPAVTLDTRVDEALVQCHRERLSGLAVLDGDVVVGSVSEPDLERAAGHRLGHAPVKAVMTSGMRSLSRTASVAEATALLATEPLGWLPVMPESVSGQLQRDDVLGFIVRTDLGPRRVDEEEQTVGQKIDLAPRLAELGLSDLLRHIQAVATAVRGVYLVGGAVRDLLLGEPTIDIDLAVEGDGIEFAGALARRLRGHVRAHGKFQTAVVVVPAGDADRLRIDVASTRSEFYDYPAALPKVEHATIRSDLARRDFTINAMAVSLKPESYGRLLDFFGGVRDLGDRRIVVLHNLSFIEDPTRIFRAIRYESRYGLRMDAHTINLARGCSSMDLVGDLSSARLRDELVVLLGEPRVDFALRRMGELDVARAVHPRLDVGTATRDAVLHCDALWRGLALAGEVPLWRARLVWLLSSLEPGEIEDWARRMRFRRADTAVLARAHVVGRRIAARLGRASTEAEVYDLARLEPLEALLVAMVRGSGGVAEERLSHYIRSTRHVRLTVDGDDLRALGFRPSPALGEALHALMQLKLSGAVSTREEELEAARRLAEAAAR